MRKYTYSDYLCYLNQVDHLIRESFKRCCRRRLSGCRRGGSDSPKVASSSVRNGKANCFLWNVTGCLTKVGHCLLSARLAPLRNRGVSGCDLRGIWPLKGEGLVYHLIRIRPDPLSVKVIGAPHQDVHHTGFGVPGISLRFDPTLTAPRRGVRAQDDTHGGTLIAGWKFLFASDRVVVVN